MKRVPVAELFWAVSMRFCAFATASIRDSKCPFGNLFKKQIESLLVNKPLGRNLKRCIADGGCFGHSISAPCGGPGELHYGYTSGRERAEIQRQAMAAVIVILGEAQDIMMLHADAPEEIFAKSAARFEAFLTPAMKAKMALARDDFRV